MRHISRYPGRMPMPFCLIHHHCYLFLLDLLNPSVSATACLTFKCWDYICGRVTFAEISEQTALNRTLFLAISYHRVSYDQELGRRMGRQQFVHRKSTRDFPARGDKFGVSLPDKHLITSSYLRIECSHTVRHILIMFRSIAFSLWASVRGHHLC